MKKISYIFLLLFASFISLNVAEASEGTVYSTRTCFGITFGIHDSHWHQAIQSGDEYIATGDPIYSYPCTTTNDPTLSSLTVNDEEIEIADTMEITTYDEEVNIVATPTYQFASVDYESTKELEIGENNITITVTSLGGIVKTYELKITREKILSTNNNISAITINGEEYQFENNIIDNLFITSNTTTLDLNITTEDDMATIEIDGNDNLSSGDNTITITCTAENGDEQTYYINYHKTTTATDIIGLIIGILILALPIIIIIIIIVHKNKKRYINNTSRYKNYKVKTK